MIRLNRSRFLGIVCLVTFIYFLLFTDSGSSSSEFRANTEAGLARKQQRERNLPLRGHLSDEDLTKKTHDELQGILNSPSREGVKKDEYGKPVGRVYREPQHDAPTHEDLARGGMTREEPARHNGAGQREQQKMSHEGSLVAEDPGAAERKTTYRSTEAAPRPERKNPSKAGAGDADIGSAEDPGDAFVTKKLEEYLKSPVVIFSKSYCPHSRRAKQLLLDIYKINPEPLVVELDLLGEHVSSSSHHDSSSDPDNEEHPRKTLGRALQDLLTERTGRRTVPNIVVGSAHSIGGNDNLWEMHESGTLAEEIKKFGGRRVISVDVHDTEDGDQK
ncbi:hypothetical protein LTR70_005591 [Exophiala xenobiotica]|uniref:Glutaredoxin domain-containing protein n=1 Tax=Lithohypha guttulata TaxID=1690604 RepID=A0ABR0K983_9EURO|nr:hypothetical protein LTR24_005341 [Lithohypha guttulata]KAK5318008.1 hypothetical protein LTR70_005591 [Exophiala xenobiotica]